MDVFAELQAAVHNHDDWASPDSQAQVVEWARRFVGAVEMRAQVIEHMRQTVTPTAEALAQIMGDRP